MRLLLLNQFGPDSGAPTGRILGELGAELERSGHQVSFLHTDSDYGRPRRGAIRLLQELLSHLRFVWRSLWRPKADAVISLTSPACLAVTAGFISLLHRARHYHWAMDLYPDVGARLGELRNPAVVGFFSFLMRLAYHRAHRVVVLDEDMRDYVRTHYGVDSAVVLPFPPEVAWPTGPIPVNSPKRWLYSGNFGRAHEIQVLLEIQKILEARGVAAELVLQGQGPQFESSRAAAANLGLRQVQWRPPVPQEKLGESLVQSDILVVTRKADIKGLLLPSKLMLAELSGRAILWIGDTDGKTAGRLAAEGRHGVFTIDQAEPIAAWLQSVFAGEPSAHAIPPRDPREVRLQAARQWEELLRR